MKKQIKESLPVISMPSPIMARGVSDEAGLEQYIQSVQKFPILTAEQEYEYAAKWRNFHDKLAAEQLVASHLRMVVSVAYDFKNYGIPIGDLIASGNLGLMQALQKFEPERGFRFSTYAMFWIKAEIYETILNNWSIVKIGSSANQKRVFFNLSRAKKALGIMDSRLSGEQVQKIANFLQVPESDVARMSTRMSARDLSLNAPAHNDDSDGRDVLSNMTDDSDGIEDTLEQREFRIRGRELLKKHLAELSERDRAILIARRLSQPAQTLEMLSQKYGISRERVRQIEERAYAKLRSAILAETQRAEGKGQKAGE
ncbi:MAG: RNA polymerase factor sigma-32 [Rickettsiales bacterium]|jgi:RNA polymerase sigma-32 factor|nr:RNA polymerase factor sigma-32 [Rickettsiales bacterium]